MPVAAVGAAATVAVGYMQHRAASNAAKAQERASKEALFHETQREAIGDKRYDDQAARVAAGDAAYQRDLAEWKARHGYGPSGGGAPGKAQENYSGAPPPGQVGGGWTGPMAAQPRTLQDLAGAAPGGFGAAPTADQAGSMADASTGQGQTLQDLSEWNDWKSKGLGA